jgi:hypothetical protein
MDMGMGMVLLYPAHTQPFAILTPGEVFINFEV